MVRIQISMTEEQADGLRRLSAARKRSLAALLREALNSVLADDAVGRRVARVRGAIGAHRSGRGDISENHDDELIDALPG